MRQPTVFLGAIFAGFIILAGCSSGPSEEEIAASVEAQLAVAQTETAEAVPADTTTPIPTDTPVPTTTNVQSL